MSELRFKCWNCGSTPQSDQCNHLHSHWSLLMWFHYYFLSEPQFWHLSKAVKNGHFWRPKKANMRAKKKDIPRIHACMDFLQKKRVQIGLIWPPWPHLYFTSAYRGSPPCTLFQHPDNREIGYSNVLPYPHLHPPTLTKNLPFFFLISPFSNMF